MSTVAIINARRKAAGLPLIRFDLRRLQPEDVTDLRDAYAALYEISLTAAGDNRGYWATARGHGYDLDLCHRDSRIFLTWHRAYVYAFEKALSAALQWKRRDPNLVLTLPYWNWTLTDPATDAPNGLPKVLNDPTYVDGEGKTQPNPLYSAPSLYRIASQGLTGDARYTQRFPTRLRGEIAELKQDVADYMLESDFARFSSNFNGGAHGTVHVVTGGSGAASPLPGRAGDLSSVISAAYDPVFWLHHSMVDKVWFDWQAAHGNSTVPEHVLEASVYGGFIGSEVIDAERSLRYIYSEQAVELAEPAGATAELSARAEPKGFVTLAATMNQAEEAAAPAGTQLVPVGTVHRGFARARLDFHSLRPPKESYELRVFFNNQAADATTSKTDPTYGGRLVLFGHGRCHGALGHCNPTLENRDDYDLRPKHPLRFEKTSYTLDITDSLRAFLAGDQPVTLELTLVTVGLAGELCAADAIEHDGVSLVIQG